MWKRTPDWLIYFAIVLLIYLNAARTSEDYDAVQPPPPVELGPLLPVESPRDAAVLVEIEDPESGVGTAFSIDDEGHWVTARHVVDSCDSVGLRLGNFRAVKAAATISPDTDTALLTTDWTRPPLPTDLNSQRRIGERAYFFGFPQGRPGEAVGTLLGRHRMIVRGRYETEEPILAWTEVGRTLDLKGSLGGLSGGPVLDEDGEVVGIVAAESPRRGRIYTVAPRSLRALIPDRDIAAEPIDAENYGRDADRFRRDRRIIQVMCLVK